MNDVLPDSPAAKAGVQRFDVLTKFNDQQLVDSGQFSTLVRALKKDTEASLTFVRKAQEQKVTVKIDERLLPERRPFPFPGGFPSGDARKGPGDFEAARGQMHERMRSYGDKMHEFQERMKAWQKNPSAEVPQPPEPPTADAASGIQPEDILREVRPGGVAQIHLLKPDVAVTYNMANARLVMKDDTGEIEMTIHDGKRSLVARNAQGESIFDGPIDTEEQRKALPEDIRKKIELIEVQRKLAETPQAAVEPGLLPDVQ
ncbi:MAG: PDZ domain-containing protein [Chthoniobacter sp.]